MININSQTASTTNEEQYAILMINIDMKISKIENKELKEFFEFDRTKIDKMMKNGYKEYALKNAGLLLKSIQNRGF